MAMFRLVLIWVTIATVAHGRAPGVTPVFPPLDGRIVGGKDTVIEEHPYQLSLGYFGGHSCGASLIKPNVALTAAHCTHGASPSSLTVRAGSTDYARGGIVAKVLQICSHPKYYPYDYDVSVLLLDQALPLGPTIQTIDPQPVGEDVSAATLAVVTGWGRLSSGGSLPSVLQAVEVPRISQEDCRAAYGPDIITDRMSCYGYMQGGKDSCQGDSGGPLVVDGKVCGIVSWGLGCADPYYPGVYANVGSRDINEHIQSCLAGF